MNDTTTIPVRRLTQGHRDIIVRRAVADTLAKRKAALERREHALFDRLLRNYLGKHRAAFQSLPPRFCQSTNYVATNAGGLTIRVHRADAVPAPERFGNGYSIPAELTFEAGTRMCRDLQKMAEQREDLKSDERALEREIAAVVNRFTTLRKLLETWPQARPYVPEALLQDTKANLPAVPVDQLNARMAAARKGERT